MADSSHRKRKPRTSVCGAKLKGGRTCGHPKGWGTDHAGSGRCKFHGGSSRNGRKAANRERALSFARGQLGAEVAGTPLDALEQSVRLAAGLVDYYRYEIADATLLGASRKPEDAARGRQRVGELVGPYTEAVKLQKDVAKAATDAGVAERRTLLAERTAQMLGAAFDDALAAVVAAQPELSDVLTAAVRGLIVERFAAALSVIEGSADELDPLALASG